MFRRKNKLSAAQIEELLLEFDVRDGEIEELKRQDALNIRKLRVVATSGLCPYSENVRDALDSAGELESKSVKLKMARFIRKSLATSERSEIDRRSLMMEEEDYDDEDLNDYFDGDDVSLAASSVNLTGTNRREDSMSLAFTNSPPKSPKSSFWADVTCIFCGSGDSTQDEPPTYDPDDLSRRSKAYTGPGGKRRTMRSRTAEAAVAAKRASKPKQLGHPELMDKFRLAVMRGEEGEYLDFNKGISPETIATLNAESGRISRLYLGILKVSDGARFKWTLFSDYGKGTEVYTAFPPGYGEGTQVAIRSTAYVNANYRRVLDIMTDDARSSSYDPNVREYTQLMVVEEERASIRHYWFHPVWPTQARDIVMTSSWDEQLDGSVIISTIGLPDYIEPSDGSVRAYVCSSSCHIRPGYSPKCPIPKEMETWKRDSDEPVTKSEGVEGEGVDEGVMDDEWCHVTFCTHIDPGGSVPAFVTNLLGPNNSLKCLMSMKAIVEKEEKEKAPLKLGLALGGGGEKEEGTAAPMAPQ